MSAIKGDSPDKAYNAFVRSDDDVEGLLAYAFSKRHEYAWLADHLGETTKNPTPSEQNAFVKSVITSERQYRVEASDALIAFAESVLEERRAGIIQEAIAGRIERSTGFWRTVLSSIIGFLAVSVLLIFIALIASIAGIDLIDAITFAKNS